MTNDELRKRLDPTYHVKKLESEALVAFKEMRLLPGFPTAHLRVMELGEALTKSVEPHLPTPALPSPERLDYAVRLLDIWCESYVSLVSNIKEQELFAKVLIGMQRRAWKLYRGITEIEPLANNVAFLAIIDRGSHWYKESYRILTKQGGDTGAGQLATNPAIRRGYRKEIRAWMKGKFASVKAAAKFLGVSESTLKSIMTAKGDIRYGPEKLDMVLKKIGVPKSGE